MAREIAVFIGDNGTTASLEEPGKVVTYRRQQGKWEQRGLSPFALDRTSGMAGVRQQLSRLIQSLGSCRIFAARTVSGLLYKELEQAGFSIWEFGGRPVEFLEYILAQEELDSRQKQVPAPAVSPAVVETSPGCYRVSLTDIQQNGSTLTSKQVLQPLLGRPFYQLEVLCSHIPPWLEAEQLGGRLEYKAERSAKGIMLTIKKQGCR